MTAPAEAPTSTFSPAHRGDLVLVEYEGAYATCSPAGAYSGYHYFELELVSAVTTEGVVRETVRQSPYRRGAESDPEPLFRQRTRKGRPYRDYRVGYAGCKVVSRSMVDTSGAWASLLESSDVRATFKTLDEAVAFLEPYRRSCMVVD